MESNQGKNGVNLVEGGRDGVFTNPDATSLVRGCRVGEKSSGTLSKTRPDGLFLGDYEYEAQAQKSKMECKVGAKRRGFADGPADPNGSNSQSLSQSKTKASLGRKRVRGLEENNSTDKIQAATVVQSRQVQ
jgi:hypothetical protein